MYIIACSITEVMEHAAKIKKKYTHIHIHTHIRTYIRTHIQTFHGYISVS